MASEVISLAESKLRQTTLRVPPEILREARFLLDEEEKSINEFLVDALKAYIAHRKQAKAAPPEAECA